MCCASVLFWDHALGWSTRRFHLRDTAPVRRGETLPQARSDLRQPAGRHHHSSGRWNNHCDARRRDHSRSVQRQLRDFKEQAMAAAANGNGKAAAVFRKISQSGAVFWRRCPERSLCAGAEGGNRSVVSGYTGKFAHLKLLSKKIRKGTRCLRGSKTFPASNTSFRRNKLCKRFCACKASAFSAVMCMVSIHCSRMARAESRYSRSSARR